MRNYLKLLVGIFLFSALIIEGLGIGSGRTISYYLILILPFFLFISSILTNTGARIVFPQKFSLLWMIFFILSVVSSVFSVNLQNSFEDMLFYLATFLIFIFVYNNKELLKGVILRIVFGVAVIFSLLSMFAGSIAQRTTLLFIPVDLKTNFFQFVYTAWSHNHLGDFLLLPISALIYWVFVKKFNPAYLFLLIFFIPYFLFAYSRSAYLDLIVAILFILYYLLKRNYRFKKNLLLVLASASMIALLSLFILAVPSDNSKQGLLKSINYSLQKKFDLGEKFLLANRNIYFSQGLYSIAQNPFFGIGPGNFIYASEKYAVTPTEYSITGHNIFFDVFVENGLLAGIMFLALFLLVFNSLRTQLFGNNRETFAKENMVLLLFFLVIFLNFQTDFTYLIHSFYLLFIMLLGLLYREDTNFDLNLAPPVLSLFLFLTFNILALSNFALAAGNYVLAVQVYPFNKNAYEFLINSKLNTDKTGALKYLNQYTSFFSGDSTVLSYGGDVFYLTGDDGKALQYYDKSFAQLKFPPIEFVSNVYQLTLNLKGENSAKKFADEYFQRFPKVNNTNIAYQNAYYPYRLSVLGFCRKIYHGSCPYVF